MKSPWTAARDRRLIELQVAGRSAAEIARILHTTRNAVIGRSMRLRGVVYQSTIDSWKRANAKRAAAARAAGRGLAPPEARRKAIEGLRKALARGMPRDAAIVRARRAGATWREIGRIAGISGQAAQQAAAKWAKRRRR
jgi:hypothetical protein